MNSLSPEAITLINHVFKSLCGAKPSWRTGFKTNEDVNSYKEALALTFMENGIQTPDAVQKGLAEARRDESPFMPSTGEFLKWCKPEHREQCHNILPRLNLPEATPEQRARLSLELSAAIKGIK